ncbi:MAG: cell division protein FtsL [Clostridia bacterium]|nr:cell division protein FtsL [Clostridia bacterium]
MKRVRQGTVLKLALIVFFLYASVQIVDLQVQIAEKRRMAEHYRKENAELEIRNQTMQNEIDKGLTDEQVARVAQEKLGLAEPDEKVFVSIPG